MAVYKPNLILLAFSIFKEYKAYILKNLPHLVAYSQGIISKHTDILYFDLETLDQIELTAPSLFSKLLAWMLLSSIGGQVSPLCSHYKHQRWAKLREIRQNNQSNSQCDKIR
ncbi:hypothetical protein F5Y19DRAFT_428614 [Xylariaceae sp. FL1651]|nr:hypothetical protein F5Y19DRAFT_428614 [Xylariaceae sp. FL1651]